MPIAEESCMTDAIKLNRLYFNVHVEVKMGE